jgi:tryptophan synthase
VTFVTAGYPNENDTVPILLAMQGGGADIIELGMPFSDPIADGPAIQESNTVRGQSSNISASTYSSVRSHSRMI